MLDAARDHLTGLRARYAERDRTGLVSAVREDVLTHLTAPTAYANASALQADADPAVGEHAPSQPPPVLPVELRTGDAALDAAAADLLTAAAARSAANDPFASTDDPPSPDPLGRVNEASRILLAAHDTWRAHPQLGVDPGLFAQVASVDDLGLPDDLGPTELLRRPVVTTPRPYLRWDPVPHPALVARRELGTGEQLSRLVVRSGLAGGGADPDDQPTTERHVVPPKATQVEAETAGKFDAAMGLGADTTEVSRLYPVALAERGTLLDRKAPSLTDPTDAGAVDQPGIALLSRPGADPSRRSPSRTSRATGARRSARGSTSRTTSPRCGCRTCPTPMPPASAWCSTTQATRTRCPSRASCRRSPSPTPAPGRSCSRCAWCWIGRPTRRPRSARW